MPPLSEGKLLDFFRFFDPERAQHVEGVRRLERALRDQAPQLLTEEAYWVQGWRSTPEPDKPEPAKAASVRAKVRPLAQSNGVSCGQCSVAMAANLLTGSKLDDQDISRAFGFGLLEALQSLCPNHRWWDSGNLSADDWPRIQRGLEQGCPAIVGLNGPLFSPSGRGHIVLIVGLQGELVEFADPAYGRIRACKRRDMEEARPHPQGKFLFLCEPR